MSDRLTELLTHTADQLARGAAPPPLAGPAEPGRIPRRAAPAAAAAAVVTVAVGVFLASPDAERARFTSPPPTAPAAEPTALPVRTVYATDGPELGTGPVPVDVVGLSVLARDPGETAPAVADVLARLTDGSGQQVLVGHAFPDGRVCAALGYLPPGQNQSVARQCRDTARPPYGDGPVTLYGEGPLDGPASAPAASYGSAVPGTRTVELSAPGRDPLRVPARDAGEAYGHRAYYLARWDPTKGATTVRAYDEGGQLLAVTTGNGPPR